MKLISTNEVLFRGNLFGAVVSRSAMWGIVDDDPTNRFRGRRLVISLEKAHGYQDIWASVLDRDYIRESRDMMQ